MVLEAEGRRARKRVPAGSCVRDPFTDAAHHVLPVLAYGTGGGDLGPLRVDFGGGVIARMVGRRKGALLARTSMSWDGVQNVPYKSALCATIGRLFRIRRSKAQKSYSTILRLEPNEQLSCRRQQVHRFIRLRRRKCCRFVAGKLRLLTSTGCSETQECPGSN